MIHISPPRVCFSQLNFPVCPTPPQLAWQTPVELSDTPGEIRHRAPTLEHTDAILQDLGYTDTEIAGFHDQRIV